MRVIYWLCLLSYALASVQVLLLLGGQPWHWGVLLALPLGWYVADAMSGLVHMLMDYHPCRPGVGLKEMFFYEGNRSSEDYLALRARTLKKLNFFETVSFDFKTHHPRPNALGRRTFEHQTLSLTVVLLPAFVGLNAALLLQVLDSASVALFLWVALSGMLLSQYLHGTLHRKKNPALIDWMRRSHLLITEPAHDLHHATLNRDFATINGWSNPILNHVFNALQKRGWFDPQHLEPQ